MAYSSDAPCFTARLPQRAVVPNPGTVAIRRLSAGRFVRPNKQPIPGPQRDPSAHQLTLRPGLWPSNGRRPKSLFPLPVTIPAGDRQMLGHSSPCDLAGGHLTAVGRVAWLLHQSGTRLSPDLSARLPRFGIIFASWRVQEPKDGHRPNYPGLRTGTPESFSSTVSAAASAHCQPTAIGWGLTFPEHSIPAPPGWTSRFNIHNSYPSP